MRLTEVEIANRGILSFVCRRFRSISGDELAKKRKKVSGGVDPFRAMARVLHSAGNLRRGLAKIRATISTGQIPILIEGLLTVPAYRPLLVKNLFPDKIEDIRLRIPEHGYNKNNDFFWTSYIISKYVEEINFYVSRRDSFHSALISGEYDGAEAFLSEIETKLGQSLWTIEGRFALLQARDGLVAQRDYLENMLDAPGLDRVTAYLAYWFSYRSDSTVSGFTINQELDDLPQTFGANAPAANFYTFCLDPNSTERISHPHLTVYGMETAPLVDRYNSLVRMLVLDCLRCGGNVGEQAREIETLLAPISDFSLETWKSLAKGEVRGLNDEERQAQSAFDAYTIGDYDFCAQVSSVDMAARPAVSPLYELQARAVAMGGSIDPAKSPDTLQGQARTAIAQMTEFAEGSETAPARLERIALSCPMSFFAMQITAFSGSLRRLDWRDGHSEAEQLWAVISGRSIPWNYEILRGLGLNFPSQEIEASPALRLRANFEIAKGEGQADFSQIGLPPERAAIYEGHADMLRGRPKKAIKQYTVASKSASPLTALLGKAFQHRAYIDLQDYSAAINLIVTSYYENPHAWTLFEVERVIEEVAKHNDPVRHTVQFANLALIATRHFSQKFETLLSDSYERALGSLGVLRPAELLIDDNETNIDLVFFLQEVCTIRVMEDSTEFDDLDDIERERVILCNWLTRVRPGNKEVFEQEIRLIVRNAQISDLRAQLEQTKIFVDEGGIRQILQSTLREKFDRYIALLAEPDVDAQADQITKRLSAIFENIGSREADKVSADIAKIKLPSTERVGVLRESFNDVLDRFLFSPEFGLDAHLSSRIRHGTFLGHTRSPFAKRKLLPPLDGEQRDQDETAYWTERFPDLEPRQQEVLAASLRRFSQRLGELVDKTNDEILHITILPAKAAGMFVFDQQADVQESIAPQINEGSTYDEFVDVLFDAVWRQADESMARIRSHLADHFEVEAFRFCDLLEKSLEDKIPRSEASELFDAIAQARNEFSLTMTRISDWFRRPARFDSQPVGLDVVADVAVKEIQSCYQDKSFTPDKCVAPCIQIRGRKFDGCVEILFILIQNAIKHSGQSDTHNISIEADADDRSLIFTVTNDLGEDVDLETRRAISGKAQAAYNSRDALERVRREGGSGLSKIWRTAEYGLKVDHAVELRVTDDRKFVADVLLDLGGLV